MTHATPARFPLASLGRVCAAAALAIAMAPTSGAVAQAQPVAAAPRGAVPVWGAPLSGVCVFDRDAALSHSLAGASGEQQLAQFASGIKAELDAQRAAIERDDHALAADKGLLPASEYAQKVVQLRQRYDALDHTRQQREAQLARTRADAVAVLSTALDPALAEVIGRRRCAVVLARGAILGANPAMDVTAAVVEGMNARLTLLDLRLADAPGGAGPR